MSISFFIVFAVYFSLLIALWVGWQLTFEKAEATSPIAKPAISVLIPYRNEEANLKSLLESVAAQNYPKDRLEIILIDDHSTDCSAKVVEEFAAQMPNIKSQRLSKDEGGKKRALACGIQSSSHEIMVTTDADCTHDRKWISTIANCFQSNEIKMAVGGVRIDSTAGFFAKLQALEFASLVGTTVSTLFYRQPMMCSGANLAFRKQTFIEVGGYEDNYEIASGDDEFLMRKIHTRFPNGLVFMSHRQSVVTTQPVRTLKSFIHQRLRWAGKWKFNSSTGAKWLAIFILIVQFSYVLLPIVGWCGWIMPERVYFLIVGKLVLEFMLLYPVTFFLQMRWRWIPFLILQVIYPFYVIGVALVSQHQSVSWKDRTI